VGSINYSQAIRPDRAYIKKIIESSLLADWAISIEYECGESHLSNWRVWGETCFAITSAKPVIDALLDCYAKNPRSTIRINAEKFCPKTRLLYTVYNPQYLNAETELTTETATRQSPNINAREDQRGQINLARSY
jgi:ribulose bisphosphate carboxylase small subunit